MGFETFESAMQSALDNNRIVGAAVIATDRLSDEPWYTRAFGSASVDKNASPMQLDSMMWVASCTKLMTAIAVLQCVEQGLLDLDADISLVLPEWKSATIVEGFDDSGNPLTKKATGTMTLRQLLTHSSGMGYDGLNPILTRYRKAHRGLDISLEVRSIAEDHSIALTFEPGHGWDYGSGIDWAGIMIERVNGGIRLGEYMDQFIWQPLGMSSTTFRILQRPDLLKRLCGFPTKQPDGTLAPDSSGLFPVIEPVDDSGGSGSYSCATDYIKLLASLLCDDGRLLRSEMVEELFRPQLQNTEYMDAVLSGPQAKYLLPGLPPAATWNHALGGIVAVNGLEGRMGKGTMMWYGLPNSYWVSEAAFLQITVWNVNGEKLQFIDRERGVCGIYASQMLPPGDEETAALNAAFQTAVYEAKID